MKAFFALCLLFAAVNSYSLDGLKWLLEDELEKRVEVEEPREITLREHLDQLETPDPLYRSLSKRSEGKRNCAAVCGPLPAANHAEKKCDSKKWVPEYEADGDCECLKKYRCCADTCPEADPAVCHKNNQKGYKYGVPEVDCCGCQVIKCLDCPPPLKDTKICGKDKPKGCYKYTKNSIHKAETGCYEATCTEKPSDAAPAETCDDSCQGQIIVKSHCLFDQKKCNATKLINRCTKRKVENNKPDLPTECYEKAKQEVDTEAGKYYDPESDKCQPCQKWRYDKLSCEGKNAAVAAADCHQEGAKEYDRKCMKKIIKKDECECDKRVCVVDHSEPPAEFLDGEVCPKDNVKLAGTSICGSARDLCFPCPAVVPMDRIPCEFPSKVVESVDCNGCKNNICGSPQIVSGECSCKKYVLNTESNSLTCDCQPVADLR